VGCGQLDSGLDRGLASEEGNWQSARVSPAEPGVVGAQDAGGLRVVRMSRRLNPGLGHRNQTGPTEGGERMTGRRLLPSSGPPTGDRNGWRATERRQPVTTQLFLVRLPNGDRWKDAFASHVDDMRDIHADHVDLAVRGFLSHSGTHPGPMMGL